MTITGYAMTGHEVWRLSWVMRLPDITVTVDTLNVHVCFFRLSRVKQWVRASPASLKPWKGFRDTVTLAKNLKGYGIFS